MSNLEYVRELCGSESIGTIAERLVVDLDERDESIASLTSELSDMKKGATLEDFYLWAKRLGHYHAYEAVERYRRICDAE